MALPKGLTVEQDIVAQEFDLVDITGRDLDDATIRKIGESIIDYTRKRAADNKGIGGKALRSPYSKDYAHSDEFKNAGKSPTDVNMKLRGDMLASIDVLDIHDGNLIVGIEGEQAPKAHGHMTGKMGQAPKMKREFFGLTKAELQSVLDKHKDIIESAAPSATTYGSLLNERLPPELNARVDRITIGELFGLVPKK